MEFGDRRVRVACSAHLLTDEAVRTQALGALILRRYLDGPQDATITDGATRDVQRMWESFGGASAHLQSFVWIEPIRPATLAAHRLAHRAGARRLESVLRPLSSLVDVPARRARRVDDPAVEVTSVDAGGFAAAAARAAATFKLRPVYDISYLSWLFAQLERVASEPAVFPDRVSRGRLGACTVAAGGRELGAFVCQTRPGGACRVLAIVARERDAPAMLAAVRARAEEAGAAAVFGRVEPHLLQALWERRVLIRFGGGRMLVKSSDETLESAPALGHALLTRLDGEWW
jgi:hypothetical protein